VAPILLLLQPMNFTFRDYWATWPARLLPRTAPGPLFSLRTFWVPRTPTQPSREPSSAGVDAALSPDELIQ
jgi:hypothetical protein